MKSKNDKKINQIANRLLLTVSTKESCTPFARSSKRPAYFQQTSSKCIQNTRSNCSTFAGRLLLYVIMDEPARCLPNV